MVGGIMSQSRTLSNSWNFGEERESLIHRIHAYPAKFPGFITTRALQYAERNCVEVNTIADVFCGCGTTAVEAKRNGKNFWGCDINPVATLIAQVKTKRYDDAILEIYITAIEKRFETIKTRKKDITNVNDRIKYWFNEKNIEDLLKLNQAITLEISNHSKYKKFFLCAFSNILKPTSNWLTKSIKPQFDPDKSPSNVMEAFKKQLNFMRKANKENIFLKANSSYVQIMRKNFLSMHEDKYKADLIVTSPPYVTSYDYADIHQLSALWFGFCSDYRELRKNMVGNGYKIQSPSTDDIGSLPHLGQKIYNNLLEVHKAKANSAARYFMDISKATTKCYEILNENGMAVFVIGNTSYRTVEINNAMFLKKCMENSEFKKIKIISRKISSKTLTPYRDYKGRFTKNLGDREVYKNEFVVIGRKS